MEFEMRFLVGPGGGVLVSRCSQCVALIMIGDEEDHQRWHNTTGHWVSVITEDDLYPLDNEDAQRDTENDSHA